VGKLTIELSESTKDLTVKAEVWFGLSSHHVSSTTIENVLPGHGYDAIFFL
jgi:hypothetical protein